MSGCILPLHPRVSSLRVPHTCSRTSSRRSVRRIFWSLSFWWVSFQFSKPFFRNQRQPILMDLSVRTQANNTSLAAYFWWPFLAKMCHNWDTSHRHRCPHTVATSKQLLGLYLFNYFSTSVIIFQIKTLREWGEWFKSRPRCWLPSDSSRCDVFLTVHHSIDFFKLPT